MAKYVWQILWGTGREYRFPLGVIQIKPAVTRTVLRNRNDVDEILKYPLELACTIFTKAQVETQMFDRIVLDLDTTKLHVIHGVYGRLLRSGVKPESIQVIKTGKKGYHIWICMTPTHLESYRESVIQWCTDIGIIKHVDMAVFEPNRVMRIPYTWRYETGEMCIPIDMDDMDRLELDKMTFKPSKIKIRNIPARYHNKSRGVTQSVSPVDSTVMPPCIKQVYDMCVAGKHLHYHQYFALGTWLAATTNLESYLGVLSQCSNFEEREAETHYHYWREHKTHTYGCVNMIKMKMCPYKCPIFPSIARWQKTIKMSVCKCEPDSGVECQC